MRFSPVFLPEGLHNKYSLKVPTLKTVPSETDGLNYTLRAGERRRNLQLPRSSYGPTAGHIRLMTSSNNNNNKNQNAFADSKIGKGLISEF